MIITTLSPPPLTPHHHHHISTTTPSPLDPATGKNPIRTCMIFQAALQTFEHETAKHKRLNVIANKMKMIKEYFQIFR